MNFTTMREAVKDAERTMRAAEIAALDMAVILSKGGRLRGVGTAIQGHDALRALKHELRNYNAKTGEWK